MCSVDYGDPNAWVFQWLFCRFVSVQNIYSPPHSLLYIINFLWMSITYIFRENIMQVLLLITSGHSKSILIWKFTVYPSNALLNRAQMFLTKFSSIDQPQKIKIRSSRYTIANIISFPLCVIIRIEFLNSLILSLTVGTKALDSMRGFTLLLHFFQVDSGLRDITVFYYTTSEKSSEFPLIDPLTSRHTVHKLKIKMIYRKSWKRRSRLGVLTYSYIHRNKTGYSLIFVLRKIYTYDFYIWYSVKV